MRSVMRNMSLDHKAAKKNNVIEYLLHSKILVVIKVQNQNILHFKKYSLNCISVRRNIVSAK